MRQYALVVVGSLALAGPCLGQPKPAAGDVAIYGVGGSSCGTWLEARAAKPDRLDIRVRQFETWMQGYMTAYNFFMADRPDILKTDGAGMRGFIDQYCKEYPTAVFIAAANRFIVDQGGKLPPDKR